MLKNLILFVILLFLFSTNGTAQKNRIVSTYLSIQYNNTITDQTLLNNPWAIGLGLQAYYNNRIKFKPIIDVTADIYFSSYKILYQYNDGTIINPVEGMINIFFGSSFQVNKNIFFSVVGGPSFINSKTSFGIKPSACFYLSKTQKISTKLSYINIFKRDNLIREDFSSISVAVAIKLF